MGEQINDSVSAAEYDGGMDNSGYSNSVSSPRLEVRGNDTVLAIT